MISQQDKKKHDKQNRINEERKQFDLFQKKSDLEKHKIENEKSKQMNERMEEYKQFQIKQQEQDKFNKKKSKIVYEGNIEEKKSIAENTKENTKEVKETKQLQLEERNNLSNEEEKEVGLRDAGDLISAYEKENKRNSINKGDYYDNPYTKKRLDQLNSHNKNTYNKKSNTNTNKSKEVDRNEDNYSTTSHNYFDNKNLNDFNHHISNDKKEIEQENNSLLMKNQLYSKGKDIGDSEKSSLSRQEKHTVYRKMLDDQLIESKKANNIDTLENSSTNKNKSFLKRKSAEIEDNPYSKKNYDFGSSKISDNPILNPNSNFESISYLSQASSKKLDKITKSSDKLNRAANNNIK